MNRLAFAPAVALLSCALVASVASGQTPAKSSPPSQMKTAAGPPTQAPAAPAKFVPPVKGTANIEVIRTGSKKVGSDFVTSLKIKNTSTGSIPLLRVDEYWYSRKAGKTTMISSGVERYKKPFNPGDIIELTIKSPAQPGEGLVSQMSFSYGNAQKVDPKTVKKFE